MDGLTSEHRPVPGAGEVYRNSFVSSFVPPVKNSDMYCRGYVVNCRNCLPVKFFILLIAISRAVSRYFSKAIYIWLKSDALCVRNTPKKWQISTNGRKGKEMKSNGVNRCNSDKIKSFKKRAKRRKNCDLFYIICAHILFTLLRSFNSFYHKVLHGWQPVIIRKGCTCINTFHRSCLIVCVSSENYFLSIHRDKNIKL